MGAGVHELDVVDERACVGRVRESATTACIWCIARVEVRGRGKLAP